MNLMQLNPEEINNYLMSLGSQNKLKPKVRIRHSVSKNLRWCSRCKQFKPIIEFSKSRNRSTGVHTYCKTCAKFREKERPHRKKSPAQAKKNKLKSLYNLTINEYNYLINLRILCPICKLKSFKMVIDHDHVTNNARDCICHKCNMIIGFIEKNIDTIPIIYKYLKYHRENPNWYRSLQENGGY